MARDREAVKTHPRQVRLVGVAGRHLPGVLAAALFLVARSTAAADVPRRVVSLDYCADAHVLAVAAPGQLAALSAEADAVYAWTRGRASGVPRLPRRVEAVLRLQPDLAVTTAGADEVARLLEHVGVAVLRLGYLDSLEASFAALGRLGAALGREGAAERVIAATRRRMAALAARAAGQPRRPHAIYLTPSGTSTGAGTYIDALMRLAGLENALAARGITGWYHLRIEDFARLTEVEMVVTSFFAGRRGHREGWRVTAHPVARRWLAARAQTVVPPGEWGCAGFFAVAAAERIQEALLRRLGTGGGAPASVAGAGR
ncbi:MAG: iron ABC transporter substrate-binding protein [Rhodothalassiaceae bacterium]|nr:MAG: iron ABC transporter substrate-binding protein [Rhodothalassiaceae bacterium]